MSDLLDYIDASIFLGIILDKRHDESRAYLNIVGYKSKNKGIISHFAVSEIYVNILLKLTDEGDRSTAYWTVDRVIRRMIEEERGTIMRFDKMSIDRDLFEDLQAIDHAITDDDAFNLVLAIRMQATRSVTKDKRLFSNQRLREYLTKVHQLKIWFIAN